MRLHLIFRTAYLLGVAISFGLPGVTLADDSPSWNTLSTDDRQQILRELDLKRLNGFGSQSISTPTGVRSMGQAALTDHLYHRQQQGDYRGLRLVWQRSANGLSVSEDGLSLTRRF